MAPKKTKIKDPKVPLRIKGVLELVYMRKKENANFSK